MMSERPSMPHVATLINRISLLIKGRCKNIAKPKSVMYTGLITTKGDRDFKALVASAI